MPNVNHNGFDVAHGTAHDFVGFEELVTAPIVTELKSPKIERSKWILTKKKKILISSAVLLTVLISIAIALTIILGKNNGRKNEQKDEFTTRIPESTTWISTAALETTTKVTSTTETSTTEFTSTSSEITSSTDETSDDMFRTVSRADWRALPLKSKKKLASPTERVMVMDTQTVTCSGDDACINFVQNRQNSSYLANSQDLPENFLISTDGTIYEGRGYSYEGQHSNDRGSTSYNKAIGVSFIGNLTENIPSDVQLNSLKYFIEKSVGDGKVKEDYKLYFREQLIGSNEVSNQLYDAIKTFDHWKESKSMSQQLISMLNLKISDSSKNNQEEGVECINPRHCERVPQRLQRKSYYRTFGRFKLLRAGILSSTFQNQFKYFLIIFLPEFLHRASAANSDH